MLISKNIKDARGSWGRSGYLLALTLLLLSAPAQAERATIDVQLNVVSAIVMPYLDCNRTECVDQRGQCYEVSGGDVVNLDDVRMTDCTE